MDQVKIGKFIAECRKEKKLTQAQLAEKLGVTDRAVSKWETGKCLPDASLMPELCEIIGISLNDLFNGRRIAMKNYKEVAEATMLEMRKIEEQKNKMLLTMEIVMGLAAAFALIISAVIFDQATGMSEAARAIILTVGIVQFFICMFIGLNIETKAGYYKCAECGHTYVPEYKSVFFAMHMGWTRRMTCPCCGKKSWQKKLTSRPD